MKTIGERIKIARMRPRLSQESLAKKIGVSKNTIANYESDSTPIPASILLEIAKVCDISELWLLTGKPSNFFEFMTLYLEQDTPEGDFARDAFEDMSFPKFNSKDMIISHLSNKNACTEAIHAYKELWKIFKKQNPEKISNEYMSRADAEKYFRDRQASIASNYIPIDQAERNHVNPEKGYKIVATVPAGIAEVQEHDWYETAPLEYDQDTHCFIRVDEEFGFSMMPTIAPGDLILISFTQKVQNGDLVAARWDDTKGALKIYTDNPDIPDMAVLTSYNQAIPPIFVNKNKVRLYKVVLIKKKR